MEQSGVRHYDLSTIIGKDEVEIKKIVEMKHRKQNLEIIGLGTLQSHNRTTYVQNVIYVENGRERSTFLYISKWIYDGSESNSELRELLLNELVKQLEVKQ